MISQVRYPGKIIQKDEGDEGSWVGLDNIKLDDWDKLAVCNLKSHQKPATLFLSDFNFNIPEKAVITQIIIEHDFHKEDNNRLIVVDPPILKLEDLTKESHVGASIYPTNRNIVFNRSELDLTVEDICSPDFTIEIDFPENMSQNEGELYLDFVRIKVVYDYPRYVLSTGETSSNFPNKENPLEKTVGDKFQYFVTFRNSNGLLTDEQEVKLSIPDELEIDNIRFKSHKVNRLDADVVDSFKDKFDKETLIWRPSVRGKSFSTLGLDLKCKAEGTYSISCFNEYTGSSMDFYVKVYPKGHKFTKKESKEFEVKKPEDINEELDEIEKETAIKVDSVFMEFEMPQEKIDNLKEYVIKWIKREIKPKKHFKALDNVSFEIKKGERVGIIGFNGAGKSTLLKVLAGVYTPTKGHAEINGNVAPLLELGAGFDHNYTGRENVFLNGSILGYSRKFLESKYDEILEFSELGEFMEIPIKNYSSGMQAKLGFSVATIVNPEILIIDEVLSVGDVKFQKKSGDKIKSMMDSGTTVLLVSHSTAKIRELCTRAIWLDNGKLVMDGDVDYVCDAYIEAAKKASDDELKDLELV